MYRRLLFTSMALFILLLSGAETPPLTLTQPDFTASGNPAAIYCVNIMGYPYETISDGQGGQSGICILPDNTRCEQWDFYAGTCGAEHNFCARQNLLTETRSDGQDPFSPYYTACLTAEKQALGSVSRLANLDRYLPEVPLPDLPFLQAAPLPAQAELQSLPSAFDWRNYNGSDWVTPVKNQFGCGSCWAFAAVGVVEAHHNIISNNPNLDLDLSEQELVSCSGAGTCSGGSSSSALYVIRDLGIIPESCFPYTAEDDSCIRCAGWESNLTHIDTVVTAYPPTPDWLRQNLVAYGPIYTSMGIGSTYGGYYDTNHIYRCATDTTSNHAVLIVGYNDTEGYWIIKNSWGTSFADAGYFKVGYGECRIDNLRSAYTAQIPPSKAGSVGPNGWSGPYTNDTTPDFTWTAATDSGSGVKGYYVAVDDWTPDGNAPNDWWAGNLTSFTVPAALSDGEHIFAVTSQDNMGNVNPEDTNLQADSVYYTFSIDTAPPTSTVNALPAQHATPSFTVSWSGADALSGVASYDVQYRKDEGGAWTDWINASSSTSASFTSSSSGTFYFRSRARDQAGNLEDWPAGDGDTHTQVIIYSQYLPMIANMKALIPNADFEQGASLWTISSTLGRAVIYPSSSLPVPPHAGSWAAWLGGNNYEDAFIQQSITIPSDKYFLTYYQRVDSEEVGCTWDYAYFYINGVQASKYGLCDAAETGGWAAKSLDLNAYKGQTVLLKIRVTTDGVYKSSLFLDDLNFSSTAIK